MRVLTGDVVAGLEGCVHFGVHLDVEILLLLYSVIARLDDLLDPVIKGFSHDCVDKVGNP